MKIQNTVTQVYTEMRTYNKYCSALKKALNKYTYTEQQSLLTSAEQTRVFPTKIENVPYNKTPTLLRTTTRKQPSQTQMTAVHFMESLALQQFQFLQQVIQDAVNLRSSTPRTVTPPATRYLGMAP